MKKEYRERKVKEGKCPICCARPPVSGKSSCQKCLDRAARNARKRRRTRSIETKNAVKRWRKEHPEENRAIFTRHKNKLREIVFNHYGNKCVCCGEGFEFLTLDHISSNGREHRSQLNMKGGTEFYRWVIKNDFPGDLQPLCMNCNWAKWAYGICPHQAVVSSTDEVEARG